MVFETGDRSLRRDGGSCPWPTMPRACYETWVGWGGEGIVLRRWESPAIHGVRGSEAQRPRRWGVTQLSWHCRECV